MFTAMSIRSFGYYIKEGLKSIIKNRVMSIASISTVAASLFIFGIFTVIVVNVDNVVNVVQNQIEIEAFVKDGTSSQDQEKLKDDISKIQGVKSVDYKSKEDALNSYVKELGDDKDMASGLSDDNPLPASFVIKADKPEDVLSVADSVRSMNGIDKVNDGKSIVQKVISVTKLVRVSSIVLMVILGVIAIFLISNTIKITVFARKREIGIMRYIGATDGFIRWPFIIEGVILGLLGGVLSICILWYGYAYIAKHIATGFAMFSIVPANAVMGNLSWQFALVGMAIGGIGSLISLRKFLVM